MQPHNVEAILAMGKNCDETLFQAAMSLAENGVHVWYISPEKLQETPRNIKPPSKEILQLITFIYANARDDLITHLHGIHLWHKIPQIIILSRLENYCNFNSADCNLLESAEVVSSLLDGVAVCAKKHKTKVFLLAACDVVEDNNVKRLQAIKDLYFSKFFYKSDSDLFLKQILEAILPGS